MNKLIRHLSLAAIILLAVSIPCLAQPKTPTEITNFIFKDLESGAYNYDEQWAQFKTYLSPDLLNKYKQYVQDHQNAIDRGIHNSNANGGADRHSCCLPLGNPWRNSDGRLPDAVITGGKMKGDSARVTVDRLPLTYIVDFKKCNGKWRIDNIIYNPTAGGNSGDFRSNIERCDVKCNEFLNKK